MTLRPVLLSLLVLSLASTGVSTAAEESEAATRLRDLGGIVMPISQADDRMEVALHLADGEIGDAVIDDIMAVPNVAWLNLAGTAVTDAGVKKLAGLKSLERLHLERTGVTDAVAGDLAQLPKLTYLNLYGTKLTDNGLKALAGSESLRKLFVWQTAVTAPAIEAANSGDGHITVVGEVALPKTDPPADEPKEKGAKKESSPEDGKKAEARKKADAEKPSPPKPSGDEKAEPTGGPEKTDQPD